MKKNRIWLYKTIVVVLLLVLTTGCKKDEGDPNPPTDTVSNVEEAFPGVTGKLMDFVINGGTITVENINDKYVFQGDIFLTEDQLNSGSRKAAGLNSIIHGWTCQTVYYKINDKLSNRKDDIMAAIQNYEANTPLKFEERTDQDNYIEFVWDADGSASYLGMIGNRQEIWISDKAITGTIIHEIGHAVGLIHEHSREDAYLYIDILWDNIGLSDKKAVANFGTINTLFKTSSFDFNSIMLYPSDAWSISPKLFTIVKKDGSTFPAKRDALSVDDINFIKSIYSPELIDIDGNVYRTVLIGNQIWMAENLKTTRLNDGSTIDLKTEWFHAKSMTPGYSYYGYSITNLNTFGALYDWYAVGTGKLCPTGWHVPSLADWSPLLVFLDPEAKIGPNYKSEIAGGKLREIGTLQDGTGYWKAPNWPVIATDAVCFSARPNGRARFFPWDAITIQHDDIGEVATWWCSDIGDNILHPMYGEGGIPYYEKYCMRIFHDRDDFWASDGMYSYKHVAVRCLKD